jgi:hypothetical protein
VIGRKSNASPVRISSSVSYEVIEVAVKSLALVADLGREVVDVAVVLPGVVDPHRQAGVVHVADDVEVQRLGLEQVHRAAQVDRPARRRLDQQVPAQRDVLVGIGFLAEVRVVDVAVGVGELAREAELDPNPQSAR